MALVKVDTRTAWLSKINWTQVIGMMASALVVFSGGKYDLPAETQVEIVTAIQSTQAVVTWILRTWFTTTVTPSALGIKSVA